MAFWADYRFESLFWGSSHDFMTVILSRRENGEPMTAEKPKRSVSAEQKRSDNKGNLSASSRRLKKQTTMTTITAKVQIIM